MLDPGMLKAAWISGSRTMIVTVVSILYYGNFHMPFPVLILKGKWFYAAVGFTSMYFGGGLIPVIYVNELARFV